MVVPVYITLGTPPRLWPEPVICFHRRGNLTHCFPSKHQLWETLFASALLRPSWCSRCLVRLHIPTCVLRLRPQTPGKGHFCAVCRPRSPQVLSSEQLKLFFLVHSSCLSTRPRGPTPPLPCVPLGRKLARVFMEGCTPSGGSVPSWPWSLVVTYVSVGFFDFLKLFFCFVLYLHCWGSLSSWI